MSFLLPLLRERAALDPSGIALDDGAGATLRWPQLADAVDSQVAALRARLRDPRLPVALLADRGIAQCVLDLALMECGTPVLSLPLFFSPAQRAHALAQAGAQCVVRDDGAGLVFEELATAVREAETLPGGTARISYTSGSTGAAKGICLSAPHLLEVARGVLRAVSPGPAARHLAILPPGVLLEEVAGCHAALLAGATYLAASQAFVGLASPFQPDFPRMVAAIEATRATSIILVPEYLAGLVACLEARGRPLPSLRLVAVGGARVSPALLARARRSGLPVRQGYGLTECGSVVSLHDGDAQGEGSVGRPLGAHRVRIARDGEILVSGPLYLGALGAPRRQATQSEEHATGDIGRLDADGRLWIEGRKSNLIITSYGRNVSPEWIEGLLLERPAIGQAMVHGEGAASLSALLVPRPGASQQDLDAAVAATNAQLPEYARVRRWRRASPFTPANGQLTGNGRLRRAQILAQYPMEEPADAVL